MHWYLNSNYWNTNTTLNILTLRCLFFAGTNIWNFPWIKNGTFCAPRKIILTPWRARLAHALRRDNTRNSQACGHRTFRSSNPLGAQPLPSKLHFVSTSYVLCTRTALLVSRSQTLPRMRSNCTVEFHATRLPHLQREFGYAFVNRTK